LAEPRSKLYNPTQEDNDMLRLRLALAFALVSTCLQANAQSPSVAPLFPVPQGDTLQSQAPPTTFHFEMPKQRTISQIDRDRITARLNALALSKFAALNTPCFALRSYNFTPGDLQSDTPRPSTSSTCTTTALLSLKQATAHPAR
jgi:hypothetical protein